MANLKTSWRLLCLAPFFALPTLASAMASAVAYGTDAAAWATHSTQKEANKMALDVCNAKTVKKDCKLQVTKALARAVSDAHTGWGRSGISLAEAEKLALKHCGDKDCKVNFRLTKPGFFSVARTAEPNNGVGRFYAAHQYDNMNESENDAIAGCEKAGQKCALFWTGVIPGQQDVAPAPKAQPVAKAEPQPKNCRPQTASIRCSSQCVNGSCVVAYENGCKLRVVVQAEYDPFTNQWKYPSPAC
ncbi:DUF4189 domain-containing protein [uncultured Ramlibacter sp.]|uniref:DUF4189 domain-containing protein n=1 Tax=uncultured Ramlibacter sp. TaxID=260755 RepID=UPI0026051B20|nr:DUF4189 domain-containing protein [uncultured Ramlibacter sp.]